MKRETAVSFVLVALFLLSGFPLSTFSAEADFHGSSELLGITVYRRSHGLIANVPP